VFTQPQESFFRAVCGEIVKRRNASESIDVVSFRLFHEWHCVICQTLKPVNDYRAGAHNRCQTDADVLMLLLVVFRLEVCVTINPILDGVKHLTHLFEILFKP
jgi:hypothetical protein